MKYGFDNLLINDREIYETIFSQQQKLPNSKLLEICRNRGILLSPYETRESLATYIANLYYDWNFIKSLLEYINHDDRSNKITSCILDTGEFEKIKEVIKEISPDYKDNLISSKNDGKNKLEINLTTSKLELNKTRMIQRPLKDQNITIEKQGNQIIIRHNSEDVLQPFIKKIIEMASTKIGTTLEPKKVNLNDILIPDFRNMFFVKLIELDPEKYTLHDVKRIRVHHNVHGSTDYDLDGDDEDNHGSIKSALLAGSSLHTHGMYKQLKKLGHYITEITWTTISIKDNILIEINAGFENPKKCTGFFYDIKWFYHFNDKSKAFVKDYTKFKQTQKSKLNAIFDNISYNTFLEVEHEYNLSLKQDDKDNEQAESL